MVREGQHQQAAGTSAATTEHKTSSIFMGFEAWPVPKPRRLCAAPARPPDLSAQLLVSRRDMDTALGLSSQQGLRTEPESVATDCAWRQ